MTTLQSSFLRGVPMILADQIRRGSTFLAPLYVETAIGHTQERATRSIFDSCPIPNHSMKAGTRVKVGTDSPRATIGSKNQWITLNLAMPIPNITPTATAMAKPPTARKTVNRACCNSKPSAICVAKIDAMTDRGGRKKNGMRPLLAMVSHTANHMRDTGTLSGG